MNDPRGSLWRKWDLHVHTPASLVHEYEGAGQVYIWLMNGTTIASSASVSYVSSNWVVAGVGDFDGDGKADILWRNTSTGQVDIWLMNGTTISYSGSVGSVPWNWSIAGVSDFDGDGKADILWWSPSTGQVYLYLMNATAINLTNGTAIASQGSVSYISPGWNIAGIGDFDGNGKADILWWNTSTNQIFIWFMNGTTLLSSGSVSYISGGWTIAGIGDFNGNGTSDILWENTSTGSLQVYDWLMSGTTISATGNFGYVSTNWQIDGLGSPAPTIYSYSASYDKVGNVAGYTDSVNGTWSFTYDSLNRVARATGSQDSNPYPNYCWQYDSFSNREWQTSSATPYSTSNGGANSCPVSAGPSTGAGYNANNQISGGSFAYDPAGNVSGDTTTGNSYLYDGEGRVCAMQQSIVGPPVMTGYLYDAEGHRVAKGSLTHFTCDTNANGFTATAVYVLGPSGEQMTEMTNSSGTWQWVHTNVYAPGLSATYDADLTEHTEGSLYFDLSDWLGTRRQQTDYAGNPCLNFTSLPYGDGLTPITVSCLSPSGDATEHHFTGKERDTESGNDYFGARYYASTMGRWLSPDPGGISLKHLANPQKWNKYAYTINNPLRYFDPDGMVEMDVQLRSFIQQKSVSDPLGRHFAGDNRGPTSSQNVTSRTTITVRIETDPSIRPGNPIISQTPGSAGQTKQLDANGNVIKTGTATTGLPTVTGGRDANGNPVLTFNQDTKNPLEPQSVTPGIGAQNLGVTVGQNGSWVETSGDLSLSPSFELNIGGNNIPLESELPGAAFGAGLIAPDVPVYNFTVLPPPPPPPPQQPHQ